MIQQTSAKRKRKMPKMKSENEALNSIATILSKKVEDENQYNNFRIGFL